MGRPKLSEAEKARRKEQRSKEKERARQERNRIKDMLRLTERRRRMLKILMPSSRLTLDYCHEQIAGLSYGGTDEVSYDDLLQLSNVLGSTHINIGHELIEDHGTFEPVYYSRINITVSNVDWTRLDNV